MLVAVINAIDETNENLVFTDKGSNYQSAGHTCSYREKTNMFVCRPTHGGVGSGGSRILTHIYNYKKEGEYYYVYISVARWISYSGSEVDRQVISSEVNDLKIYKDSDKDGELYNFQIDETNYNNFDKYRYCEECNHIYADNYNEKIVDFLSQNKVKHISMIIIIIRLLFPHQ